MGMWEQGSKKQTADLGCSVASDFEDWIPGFFAFLISSWFILRSPTGHFSTSRSILTKRCWHAQDWVYNKLKNDKVTSMSLPHCLPLAGETEVWCDMATFPCSSHMCTNAYNARTWEKGERPMNLCHRYCICCQANFPQVLSQALN